MTSSDNADRILVVGASPSLIAELGSYLPEMKIEGVDTGQEGWEKLRAGGIGTVLIEEAAAGLPATALLELIGSDDTGPALFLLSDPQRAGEATQRASELGARVFFRPLDVAEIARHIRPPTDLKSDMAKGMAAIWERFKPTIDEQATAIENAAVALLDGTLTDEQRRGAERDAHKLAGSAGTFGFSAASELAREAEGILDASTEIGRTETLRLSEIAVHLRRALERADDPSPTLSGPDPSPVRTAAPLLLVVDGDRSFVHRIEIEGEARGVKVAIARTMDEAEASVERQAPDVVLIDPDSVGSLKALAGLGDAVPPSNIIVCTEGHGFEDRLAAARSEIRFFLEKPITPSLVLDAVLRVIGPIRSFSATVMAVDDSETILAALEASLTPRGYRFVGVCDPLLFWETLRSEEPDLLLLDADMPLVSGIELCRVVRSDLRWGNLPIVFLTGSRDPSLVANVFAAGADDFVMKPVLEPELLTRVSNRLERARLVREASDLDHLTGTMSRQRVIPALEQMVDIARAEKRPVAVATIDVDGLDAINEGLGSAAGDRLLKRIGVLLSRRAGREDAVGRWNGGRFVAGFFGATKPEAVRQLAELVDDLRSEDVEGAERFVASYSAGVAEIPEDGPDVRTALRASERALAVAKAEGGGKVLPVGWQPGAMDPTMVDVVIVEDDAPLAGLLTHALETRGLSARHIDDGAEAAQLLGGDDPQIRARAVILDVDLPGLDGLGVLRTLNQSGVLTATKVVMLTVRAAEVEVLKAMELGAFDHVSKPFSVPVLMQRVERALGNR